MVAYEFLCGSEGNEGVFAQIACDRRSINYQFSGEHGLLHRDVCVSEKGGGVKEKDGVRTKNKIVCERGDNRRSSRRSNI